MKICYRPSKKQQACPWLPKKFKADKAYFK